MKLRISPICASIVPLGATLFLASCAGPGIEDEREWGRPDIVWILAEDISNELSCYGEAGVFTPHIDQLARDGTRYERAYCTGPACSVSRSSMMSGLYQTRIDAHDHRRIGSATVATFPEALRAAGYFNALGAGYSDKTDLNFTPASQMFDGADWSEAREGQPTFTQITLYGTHRLDAAGRDWQDVRDTSPNPVDTATVEIPPYFPDIQEVRQDWVVYLDQIQKMDRQVGEIVSRLKAEGRYHDALIIFSGDNGRCHLRGKNWLYEPGLKVPLVIKWPRGERAGEVVKEMVSMMDVTATIFDLGGAKPVQPIDGFSLAGGEPSPRQLIFAARDAAGEIQDHIRSVCDGRWKYIRNYMPDQGYLESKYTVEHRPMLNPIKRLAIEGKLTPAQLMVVQKPKLREELYDLDNDPHETDNLANDPRHAKVKASLIRHLDGWTEETGDTGLRGVSWWRDSPNQAHDPNNKYVLEWQDEFTGSALDSSQWAYREDSKHRSIQRRENVSVQNGVLRLDLIKLDPPVEGKTASGAGVVSKTRFHYGWYETRARLGNETGEERGWHHSFWATAAEVDGESVSSTHLGTHRTEIDGFENPTDHVEEPDTNTLSRFTQHVITWSGESPEWGRRPEPPENRVAIPSFDASEWHTYAFEWTPSEVRFYVDGYPTQRADFPASQNRHDTINVWLTAISANWNDPDPIPSKAEYDYFRYYRPVGN